MPIKLEMSIIYLWLADVERHCAVPAEDKLCHVGDKHFRNSLPRFESDIPHTSDKEIQLNSTTARADFGENKRK